MNKITSIMYSSIRTYARTIKRHKREHVGIQSKLTLRDDEFDIDEEDEDFINDIDELEGGFMQAGRYHKQHESERKRAREMLMNRIVKYRYFKRDKEPNFLTMIEKQNIRQLHQSDPKTWTIEKLSESFPALPYTIKKIIKSNWFPKSTDVVLRYDEKVAENWKNFRKGKLHLDEQLSEHLSQFRDRKIEMTNRVALAENLVPKIEFKKPKSQLFSSIIQSYLDENNEKRSDSDTESKPNLNTSSNLMLQSEPNKNSLSPVVRDNTLLNEHEIHHIINVNQATISSEQIIEKNYSKEIPQLHTKFQHFETRNENNEDSSSECGDNLSKSVSDNKRLSVQKRTELNDTNLLPSLENNKSISVFETEEYDLEQSQIETRIVLRKKKVDDSVQYARGIKIPRKLYKKGMTYRVKDCYYDDDGEFLYRIPGVRG